ncbi:hypothetical protein [Anaplasma phagocytophilum]|uniref:hypothetical protein n=1 Tax=Anaplasma phagocytophilum TaxID=948 RepID=UPI0031F9577D
MFTLLRLLKSLTLSSIRKYVPELMAIEILQGKVALRRLQLRQLQAPWRSAAASLRLRILHYRLASLWKV